MNNDCKTYYLVAFKSGRSPYSFAGRNAKRDAMRLAKRDNGRVLKMNGAQMGQLLERETNSHRA